MTDENHTLKLVARAGEVAAMLLAFGGGALVGLAPPEESGIEFASRLAFLFCVAMFLITWSATSQYKNSKVWLSAGATFFVLMLVSSALYVSSSNELVFERPTVDGVERGVSGYEFTDEAQQHLDSRTPDYPREDLLLDYAYQTSRIWTEDSVREASFDLIKMYFAMVFFFSAGVFCLTEGVLRKVSD